MGKSKCFTTCLVKENQHSKGCLPLIFSDYVQLHVLALERYLKHLCKTYKTKHFSHKNYKMSTPIKVDIINYLCLHRKLLIIKQHAFLRHPHVYEFQPLRSAIWIRSVARMERAVEAFAALCPWKSTACRGSSVSTFPTRSTTGGWRS